MDDILKAELKEGETSIHWTRCEWNNFNNSAELAHGSAALITARSDCHRVVASTHNRINCSDVVS